MERERELHQAAENEAALAAIDEVLNVERLPVVGNPDGAVKLAYFFDVNCPYCRKMHAVLEEIVDANPALRILHREMTIPLASSENAARMRGATGLKRPEE